MAHIREKNGKKPPIENKKGIVIAIPIIVIEPDEEVEVPMPRRPKVYKPEREDTTTIYGRFCDNNFYWVSNNNNADDGADGFSIEK